MKFTEKFNRFIRLRNAVVAALLAIMLTLAGCAGNAVVDPGFSEEPAMTEQALTAAPDQTEAAAETEAPAVAATAEATESAQETAAATSAGAIDAKPTATPAATAKPAATNASTVKPTAPSAKPTAAPTAKPTAAPSAKPTAAPTAKPTAAPTAKPTATPTAKPTAKPTATPTAKPAANPLFGSMSTKDIYGSKVTSSVFSNAEVTMVNIWATFCGPCVREMPDLAALADEYDSKGLQIVGIVLDSADSSGNVDSAIVEEAKGIVKDTGADYKHLIPSTGMYSAYLKKVSSVPTTVFLNSDGEQIGKAYVGSKSKSEWAKIFDEVLKEAKGN